MARKTLENVKKKKIDFLQSIKDITKWITSSNHDDEQLTRIIERNDIKNNVIKRILSYNYGFPYIIKYFDTYLNNLYDFEKFDTKLLIKSVVYLMSINSRCDSKSFMYIKSNVLKDEVKATIKDLIKNYMSTVYNIECNKRDLDMYYKLFKIGVIKDEDLLEIDKLINGDKPVIKNLNIVNYDDIIKGQDLDENLLTSDIVDKKLSGKILDFINSVKEMKFKSDICKKCPLYNKPIVVLDSNKQEPDEVDVVFIGLNPGKEEAEKELPFVGESGKYIRTLISQIPSNKTWMIFNIILCSTPNKNEISTNGNITDIISNCLNITSKIFEAFPSKLYIPIGDDAKSVFKINEKITAASGKVYSLENNITVIPLIHPSSIMRNGKNKSVYDKSVQNIVNYINPGGNVEKSAQSIDKEKVVSDDKDLLLLDVKKLENNQILMIYTDLAGNKKYLIKDYNFPILIKNKDWSECNMITNKIDDKCVLTDWQKSNISKKCRQLLENIVDV